MKDEYAKQQRKSESLKALERPPTACELPDDTRAQLESAKVAEDRRKVERDDADRRSSERLKMDANAKLCLSMVDGVEGHLVDISTHGCALAINSMAFCPGDQVWMKLDGLEYWRGTVRWVEPEQVGVQFDRPFYPAILDHLVQASKKVVCAKAA